jgi:hypothetical protein
MADRDRDETEGGAGDGGSRRTANWDAIAAIVAALVGLLAIVVSAYTAWNTHQQTRAQVWPHISIAAIGLLPAGMVKNGASPDDGGALVARNDGVGPAIVRRVEVLVNGKPEPNWSHVLKALGYRPGQTKAAQSALNGEVFSPGQKIYLLSVAGNKNWLPFKRKLFQEVIIRTCYCSTLGDCWINTWNHSEPLKRNQSVGSCAKIPKADEFRD